MASTARAYAPQRQPEERIRRPRIEVHAGQQRRLDAQQYARAMFLFRVAVAVVAVFVAIAVARIWLTSASLDVLNQINSVQSSIEEARSVSSELDVQYYALTNPNTIRAYAADTLGMVSTENSTVLIDVTPAFAATVFDSTSSLIAALETQAAILAE